MILERRKIPLLGILAIYDKTISFWVPIDLQKSVMRTTIFHPSRFYASFIYPYIIKKYILFGRKFGKLIESQNFATDWINFEDLPRNCKFI